MARIATTFILALAGVLTAGCSDDPSPRSGAPMQFVRYQTESGGDLAASAKRDAVIVLQGFWRGGDIAEIRRANPDCGILIYQNISRTSVPDADGRYNSAITRAEAQERGWDSGVDDGQESWLKFVEPNDAAGYGEFALERLLSKLQAADDAGQPVDGIFLDDDNSFAPAVLGGDPTSTAAEWNSWMEDVNGIVGPGLRRHGYDVMTNLSGALAQRNLESGGWEERQFRYFTHVFDEVLAYWPDGSPQPQRFVDEAFRLTAAAAEAGTVYVGSVPDNGDEARAAFGVALLLMNQAWKAPGTGHSETWYPVYDRASRLGRPLGPPESPSPGVWTRRFQRGSATVDLQARTATIR